MRQTVVDFQLSKVYKITSPNTDMVYIGSTTSPLLCYRLRGHVYMWNKWKRDKSYTYLAVYPILDAGAYQIELLESCPCKCRDELRATEQKWMREYGDKCCNKQRAFVTPEEIKQDQREYKVAERAAAATHNCACGGRYKTGRVRMHEKTKKHQKYLVSLNAAA